MKMTGSDSGSFHTVTDVEQARLLTEPKSKDIFKLFLSRERSAAEAATVAGCGLNAMLYRIKTLLRAGLIEVVREKPRKGRPVKLYRSLHDAYFVPFRVTPYATLEERLAVQAKPIFADLIRAYAAALRQSERYGHHIFMSEGGVWTSDLLPELSSQGLPVVYSDTTVRLRAEDARTLGQELSGSFARTRRSEVGKEEGGEAQNYFYMVALLPLDEDE